MEKTKNFNSWGGIHTPTHQIIHVDSHRNPFPDATEKVLPYGLGRSYGDSCLNDGGILLLTQPMNRILHLDTERGLIRCEAGLSFEKLLEVIVPQGWFVPVTPGTKYVTVGGAIANDIHGKNHHKAGTFGHHVRSLELLRSDGHRLYCSPEENADWFYATIGGLGLTGLITWAEFQLQPIHNPWIEAENIKFEKLDKFFEWAEKSDRDFEYTVAWIDCLAKGPSLGRGIFMRGNRAAQETEPPKKYKNRKYCFPVHAPGFLLNALTIKAFNTCYYQRQREKTKKRLTHYNPFFYPLDAILHWNRLYGKQGLYQYQCVIPCSKSREPIQKILEKISISRQGSFLGVLKLFGNKPSLGLLSFPREGVTLALDFPNHGETTKALFRAMDSIVLEAGGALYPAKDDCMQREHFEQYYPAWEKFQSFIDPKFSSDFLKRITR